MEVLKVARNVISALRHEADLPDASPSVSGALGLVWNIDNNYLYVYIRNEKTAEFYRRGPKGLSEDRLIETYSADDLVKKLTEKLSSVKLLKETQE